MSIIPRPYQNETVEAVFQAISESVDSGIAELATGLGKTFVAGIVINQFPARTNTAGRTLWLTHREELIEQSAKSVMCTLYPDYANRIKDALGNDESVLSFMMQKRLNHDLFDGKVNLDYQVNALIRANLGIVKAKLFDIQPRLVVGSIQTMINRLDRIPEDWFDLIVVDECHLAASPGFTKVLDYFKPKFRLGLSVGPNSIVEIKGGAFNDGFIGTIEEAWIVAEKKYQLENVDEYEILHLNGEMSRGWENNSFSWKPIKTMIRHACNKTCYTIKNSGVETLLTEDHSVYTVDASNNKVVGLSEKMTAKIKKGDILLYDKGWELDNEKEIDVIEILANCDEKVKMLVAVDLNGISHQTFKDFGVNYKTKWCYLRSGVYGHYLPLSVYLRMKHILPEPRFIYYESASGSWIAPKIKLSDWAYIIGFFYGDGWFGDADITFAVENNRVGRFISEIEEMPNIKFNCTIKNTKGKSKEISISNKLFQIVLKHFLGQKRCWSKKIAPSFIINWSRSARKDLLRGLIESDGHYGTDDRNKTGVYYCTTSYDLAYSILSLLRSLGCKGSINKRKNSIGGGGTINGRKISGKKDSYTVFWSQSSIYGYTDNYRYGNVKKYDHGAFSFIEAKLKDNIKPSSAPKYVYDFEMEGHPSFVADGILVHNTATPERLDGLSLGNLFSKILIQRDLKFGIDNGYLCELEAIVVETNIDLSSIGKRAGDFNTSDLSDAVDTPVRNIKIVRKWQEVAKGRPSMAFCTDVRHAMNLCEEFQNCGENWTFIVGDAKLCPNRDQRIRDFLKGKYDGICVVELLIIGFDHPDIGCTISAAPTMSRTKFMQSVVGRGTRNKTQAFRQRFGKNNCIIIDVTDNSKRHAVVNTTTLDAGKRFEDKVFIGEERKRDLIAQRDARKLKHVQEVEETFSLLALPKPTVRMDAPWMKDAATDKQLQMIARYGYDIVNTAYTKGHCNQIISNLECNATQVAFLVENGFDVSNGATRAQYELAQQMVLKKNTTSHFNKTIGTKNPFSGIN